MHPIIQNWHILISKQFLFVKIKIGGKDESSLSIVVQFQVNLPKHRQKAKFTWANKAKWYNSQSFNIVCQNQKTLPYISHTTGLAASIAR